MAYNLPLQISIQAPTSSNLAAIKKQIEAGLSGINIKGFDAKNFAKANSQIDLVTKNLEKGEDAAKSFFDRVEGKARSFAAYTVASTAILKLTGAVSAATREAIKYETELLKISQVTGDSVKSTREYGKTLAAISKQYNVNISKVAQLTRTLTQTGLSFREAAKGAEVLAKTSLLATFDSLTSTTEGLIAVMQTFNLTVSAGADILEKINAVSKSFAVEASDIVEAIRRTGGAFSTAGGQIEDLIALFTAVRSTSRESAETIATGFRTIFGRLQRPKTIEYFKQLGIQLETAEGQFVGPLQAIKNISEGLEELGIRAGSVRFAEVVEQIGGIRQISRVVPLLEQFRKTQAALDIQNKAGVQSAEDLAKAQQGLGFQLGQLKQEFTDLIQTVVNSDSFKFLADIFINSAKAVIRLVASLKPLLPILATMAAFKIGRGLSKLLSGGFNLKGMKEAAGFASGGMVPGSGNGDTVPAMLTPGEFVIRKSAVQAFGASNLASINKYKNGGKTYKPKSTGDPLLKYERFGRIGSKGLQQSAVSYSEINELGLEPAVAGGLKGAMYEKYMQQRYGIDKADGSGSFPDVNPSKAAQLVKDAGLGAKVGNKLLDGAELKYRLTEDTVKRYREGLRGQKSAQNIPMIYAEGQKFAKGGAVGTDTVPALLTPGEFVINKKSAQSFGYNNLRKINKYAKGGIVDGVQYFEDGDIVEKIREKRGPINEKALADMVKVIQKMADDAGTTFEKMSDELIDKFENGENALLELDDAVKNATGRSLELGGKNVKDLGPEAFKEASEIMKDVLQEVRSKSVAEEASKPVADVAAEDVPTPKKGKTGKAKRGISEERRKQLKEEALAKQNAEAGGSGLTRAGRREASETASAKTEIDTIAIQEKWDSYIKEEVKNAKSFYQERMNNVSDPVKLLMEGASVEEIGKAIQEQNKIQEDYKQAVADIKEQAEQLKGMDIEKAAASNQAESEAEVRTKEAEVSAKSAEEAKPVSTKPVEDATKSLADKIKQGGGKVYDSLSSLGISYAEASLQAQAIASGLANFGGFEVNQEALAQGQVKGGMLSGASEVVNKAADPKAIKGFGSQLNKVGKMLPQKLGGPVRKMGGVLLKNADKIAKGASMAAKALNVLSYIELGGGLFDSLLSEDYSAQRDNLIQLGDAAGAAEAAQKAYGQEMLRSIPIIGGFVTGLASYFNLLPTQLDGTGQLVVANARLEATINGTDKAVTKAKKAFQEAASLDDEEGQKKAIGTQLDKATELQDLSNKSAALQSGSGTSLAAGGLGAVGGAAAGAALGSVVPIIGTVLGGIAGAVIGGGMALWNSSGASKKAIIESYELQAEAAKKGAEIIQDVTKSFGSVLVEESKNMVQNGGTYEDAFKKASEAIGNENMDVIKQQLGPAGADLGKDATADIENLGDASQQLDQELLQLRSGLDQLSDKARAEREAEIARKEALQGNIDTMRDQIVAAEAARVAEEKLEKERRIAAAALKHQIKLQKEMTAERRRFNKSVRSMEDDLEDMDNAGTGNMSSRQGMEAAGYNADLYRQETGEILDSSESANEIARDIGGAAGGEVIAANKRRQKIDSITSDPEAMAEILADSTDASGKRDPEKIREKINEKLKEEDPDFKPDATFENAMVDFSNTVAKEGTSAVTKAGEAAKESVSQSAQEAIDQQKQQAEQMGKMQQELRKREIELINRNYATAQKAYDAEKAYFEKRMALNNKVEDFLDPIAEGPEKAKKMMERSNKRYAEQRAGLEERRAKQFGEVGSFTQRGGGDPAFGAAYAAGGMQGAIDYAGKGLTGAASSEDPGTDLAKFQNQIDMLSNTIADEIGIEEERLDSLIESAKAQQEYTQALNDAQGSLVRDLVTGTEEDVANQLNTMNAAAMAAQQGSFAGIPEDMKKDIFGLFDKFDDIEIPGFGKTGRDLKREITKNELMMNFGYDEATADKLASKSVNDKVPVDEKMAEQIKAQQENLQRLYEQEKQLNDYKIQAERESNQKFSDAVDRFAAKVDAEKANLEDRRQNKPPEEPEEYKEPEKEEEQKDPVADAQTALDEAEAQVQQEKDKIAGRTAKIEELDQEAKEIRDDQAAAAKRGGQSYVPDPQKAARLKEIENEKQKINSESDGGLGMLKANEARNQAQTNLRQAQADEQAKQDAEMQAKEDAFVRNSQTQNESTNSEAQASNEDRGTGGNFIDDVLDDPSYQDEDPFTPTNPPSRPTAATASSPSSMPTSIDSGVAASTGLQTSIVSDEDFMAGLREAGAIAPGMAASASTPSFSDAMAGDPSFGNPNVDPFAPQGQTSGPPSAPSMPPSAQSGGSSQSSSESNSTGSEDATSGAKGGNSDQGPLQVNTQGQQDITVRLPDVQAMVSQNISGMVFDTIGGVFNKLAEDVRSANDFNDVANAFQQGVTQTSTKQMT